MAEHRPFPASARRLALARAAGLHGASPIVVGAAAIAAIALATAAIGGAVRTQLGSWLADACRAPAGTSGQDVVSTATRAAGGVARTVVSLALPVLAAAAIAAALAHVVQTRAVWLPRRRLDGAPAVPPARAARATADLAAATVIGAVTIGWLWLVAPRLAALVQSPLVAVSVIGGYLATLAIAYVGLGALDAIVRRARLAAALRMTSAERREDARLAGADPRWRRARERAARDGGRSEPREAVAGASLVIVGDDLAVAIAWDPVRRPVPARVAAGRAARATQLIGLARRYALPVHRDAELAAALAPGDGAVPERHWPRLAELVAAIGPRTRST